MTPRPVARQAPLSMGLPRQEYQSGLPCPPPGDLPNLGIEPASPVLQVGSLPMSLHKRFWPEGPGPLAPGKCVFQMLRQHQQSDSSPTGFPASSCLLHTRDRPPLNTCLIPVGVTGIPAPSRCQALFWVMASAEMGQTRSLIAFQQRKQERQKMELSRQQQALCRH